MNKKLILDLNPENLMTWFKENKQPSFRATQVVEWLYKRRTGSFQDMTNLPKALRAKLERQFICSGVKIVKEVEDDDGTRKFLMELADGHHIEAVYLPRRNDYTLCISTQIGCALGCRYCATGKLGIVRNLTAGEIISQVLSIGRQMALEPFGNIVFMGMGEPLLNSDSVLESIRIMISEEGLAWSPRRITLSTAGIIPEIQRLGQTGLGINLAVSLNAADDKTRSRLMPINKKYPLKSLIAALKEYPLPSKQHKITFEYVMINKLNDTLEDAAKLIRLLDKKRDKLNLIPFNPIPGSRFKGSDYGTIHAFQEKLSDAGFLVMVRNSQGSSIAAACGQLANAEIDSTDQ